MFLCEIAILPICIRDFTIRTLFDVLFLEFFILEKHKAQKQDRYNREIQHETNFVVGEAENAAKNLAWICCFDFAPHVSTIQHIHRTLVKFCIIPSVNFRNKAQESIHLVYWVQWIVCSKEKQFAVGGSTNSIRRILKQIYPVIAQA